MKVEYTWDSNPVNNLRVCRIHTFTFQKTEPAGSNSHKKFIIREDILLFSHTDCSKSTYSTVLSKASKHDLSSFFEMHSTLTIRIKNYIMK